MTNRFINLKCVVFGVATTIAQLSLINICNAESHRITIDAADTSETVGRYLVGANVVYTKEEGRDWENNCKIEVLKRAGMSNLRYPGGHVVSFWDWEWPYH